MPFNFSTYTYPLLLVFWPQNVQVLLLEQHFPLQSACESQLNIIPDSRLVEMLERKMTLFKTVFWSHTLPVDFVCLFCSEHCLFFPVHISIDLCHMFSASTLCSLVIAFNSRNSSVTTETQSSGDLFLQPKLSLRQSTVYSARISQQSHHVCILHL